MIEISIRYRDQPPTTRELVKVEFYDDVSFRNPIRDRHTLVDHLFDGENWHWGRGGRAVYCGGSPATNFGHVFWFSDQTFGSCVDDQLARALDSLGCVETDRVP